MDHIYGAKNICGKFVHDDSSKIILCSTGKKNSIVTILGRLVNDYKTLILGQFLGYCF